LLSARAAKEAAAFSEASRLRPPALLQALLMILRRREAGRDA
jgi:hypothetical protein